MTSSTGITQPEPAKASSSLELRNDQGPKQTTQDHDTHHTTEVVVACDLPHVTSSSLLDSNDLSSRQFEIRDPHSPDETDRIEIREEAQECARRHARAKQQLKCDTCETSIAPRFNVAAQLSAFFEWMCGLFQNRRDFETLITKIEDRPKGYPRVGAFVDSDPQFVIYRRFGYVRHRLLLHMQDEIASLEAILERVDQLEAEEKPRNLRIRREYENSKPVKGYKGFDTLIQLKEKIREYDELLHSTRSILAVKRPLNRNVNSYYNFVKYDQSVTEDEREYLLRVPDLIHLCGGQDDTSLNGFVEKLFDPWWNDSTKSWFASKDQRQRTDKRNIHLYSQSRIDILITLVALSAFIPSFIVPIFLLVDVKTANSYKVVVVTVFTTLFTVLLLCFTNGRRHEVIAAAAT